MYRSLCPYRQDLDCGESMPKHGRVLRSCDHVWGKSHYIAVSYIINRTWPSSVGHRPRSRTVFGLGTALGVTSDIRTKHHCCEQRPAEIRCGDGRIGESGHLGL
nr:hypothetical protein CFP56_09232 [Quercus suber]